MKKKILVFGLMAIFIFLIPFTAMAVKPGQSTNPNGFPSGPHFNLNFIGKDASFACPAQEYLRDENGELVLVNGKPVPAYGNVIYIPQDTSLAYEPRIIIDSGRKGPKGAVDTTVLQVTDWCAGFTDNDPAWFRLPANEAGYKVYARALAKPTNEPTMTFYGPELVYAEDEYFNDLVYLGLVTSNGFTTPTATFTRKTGKSTAMEITGLFQWSGTVYYIISPSWAESTPTPFCAIDTNADGKYDIYEKPNAEGLCPAGYTSITLFAVTYSNDWVFNIADFVQVFYKITNNNVKLVQVRFYPQ